MRSQLTRVIAGVAALAVGSLTFLSTGVDAAPPGTPAAGTSALTPAAGTNAGNFNLAPPVGAACAGDSNTGGYRWQTFMVASSVDPATLTYGLTGPVQQGAAFTAPLYSSVGAAQINKTTAVGTGLLTPIPTFSFASTALPVPNGTYNIGYACTVSGVSDRFWSTPITISNSTATTFSYSFGAAPVAPVIGATLVPGDQTLDGTFTHTASVPATTGYTVTAVPTAGATVTLPLAAGATTFSLTGLANGTSYAVTIVATNTAGSSVASAAVNGTPNPAARAAVTGLVAAAGTGNVTLTWVAPTGVAPTGYTIAVSPTTGITGSPFTAAAGATSYVVTGTPGIGYTFTVTPTHPAPYVGTPASVGPVAPYDAQLIIQDIQVVRPQGALVLTQVCGVYGALDAEPASPGFPLLPAKAATTAVGGATGPTLLANGAGGVDPNYTNGLYPSYSPATYPTHCGINLGTATLVTTGAEAGQYYAANGQINQVTVSDTRDGQNGWTVNGTMSSFVNSTNSSVSFPAKWSGWTPKVNGTSVGQTVVAGSPVAPNTPGLAAPSTLASATTASLGIAQMDARLRLLIPVAIPSGTYLATLTFSVV